MNLSYWLIARVDKAWYNLFLCAIDLHCCLKHKTGATLFNWVTCSLIADMYQTAAENIPTNLQFTPVQISLAKTSVM